MNRLENVYQTQYNKNNFMNDQYNKINNRTNTYK
jgi:hypothetical protein